MFISRWNFSFQQKRSELQPHIWMLHKILRHSFLAWSKINDVNANFFLLFRFVSWHIIVVCSLSTKQISWHIAETHLIFKNTWMSKNWFIVSIYKRISTRFFFCRGMDFLLIHFYKFLICCRLLLYIHNLLFSRIFTVCISFLLLSFTFTIDRTVYHTFFFHKIAENEAWISPRCWSWVMLRANVRIFLDISGDAAVTCCVCGRNEIWSLNRRST